MAEFVLDETEKKKMWEKGVNAGYQLFPIFPTMFFKGFFSKHNKSIDSLKTVLKV